MEILPAYNLKHKQSYLFTVHLRNVSLLLLLLSCRSLVFLKMREKGDYCTVQVCTVQFSGKTVLIEYLSIVCKRKIMFKKEENSKYRDKTLKTVYFY